MSVIFLKQSTAVTLQFGPFLDPTDGVTLAAVAGTITDIDHATTGIFLSKNGGNAAIRHQTVTASTVDDYGMMNITLDTTDTNTLGTLRASYAKAASYCPVWQDFMVVTANIWDSLFSTDVLDCSMVQILGTAVSSPATAGILDVNLKNIANASVSATTAQLGVNVVQISADATAADSLELIIENAKGTDNKILISTDAQDLSTKLDVNAKTVGSAAVTSIIGAIIEGTVTLKQAIQLVIGFVSGKTSGGGTTSVTFRDTTDTTDRIVMTVDSNGNRSAVTRTYT